MALPQLAIASSCRCRRARVRHRPRWNSACPASSAIARSYAASAFSLSFFSNSPVASSNACLAAVAVSACGLAAACWSTINKREMPTTVFLLSELLFDQSRASSCRFSCHFHQDEGQIIVLWGIGDPALQLSGDLRRHLVHGEMSPLTQQVSQPLLAELFLLGVQRFENPIGEGHQDVARLQINRGFLIVVLREEPDHGSSCGQFFDHSFGGSRGIS